MDFGDFYNFEEKSIKLYKRFIKHKKVRHEIIRIKYKNCLETILEGQKIINI